MADKKSHTFSFRLSPELHEEEKEAEAIITEHVEAGGNIRYLITDALLHFKGRKVQERGTQRDIMAKLKRMENKIDSQSESLRTLIMEALQDMDLQMYVNPNTGQTFEKELGDRVPQSMLNQMFSTIAFSEEDDG